MREPFETGRLETCRMLIASVERQTVVPNENQTSAWEIDTFKVHAPPELI